MALIKPAVCGALAVAVCAGAGNAAILFTFEDPSASVKEFQVFAPPGIGQPGSLLYNPNISVNLTIDASQESPGARVTLPARLFFLSMTVGPVTQVGNTFIGQTSGAFEFRLPPGGPNPGKVILRGEFNDATLSTFFGTGSHLAAKNTEGGSLLLTAGSALPGILAGVGYALPGGGFDPNGPSSAAWSLTGINSTVKADTLVGFPPNPDKYFPNFAADSAFVGAATVIPTPGAVTFVGVATGLVLVRRRR